MTYRVNGRATKIEERILRDDDRRDKEVKRRAEIKSKTYSVNGKPASARKKLNELQSRWHGWAALDAEDTALFDELISAFTKKVKPTKVKPSNVAAHESNVVLLFPARMCERETDQDEQVMAAAGKQTLAVKDEQGNVCRYRSEFDNFRATENELFNYNFRRARNGTLLAPDGSECLSEGGTHRAKVRLVEAEAVGSTAPKLDSGFPCLSAIRKKDGNIVQESKGDNRCAFEVIAQLIRFDFSAASRCYLSKPVNDVPFEDGEVDFSQDGKQVPKATMTVAQREKISTETVSHVDSKTGAVWSGEVPTFENDGVRQIRSERMAWTWLELEVSPHQYDYKKTDFPRIDDGPAVFRSETPVISTEFTSDIKDGKRIQIEWTVTKQRKTRTTKTGTSIWKEITRTRDGCHAVAGEKVLKLIRQTSATVVDCSRPNPSRDMLESEARLPAQQRLDALSNLLGSEMFATARMACHDDMNLSEIAETMGLGSRGGTAVARELRVIFLQAMRLYKDLAILDERLPPIVAANDNHTARQMAV